MGCFGDTQSTIDSTSTYRPDTYAYGQYQGLMGRANDLSQRGYNPETAQNTAGFTDQQRQAFNQIGDLQGSYQPWLTQSAQSLNQGASSVSGDQISHYMDPYQQQVIDATTAQMQKQGAQQQSQLSGNATISGALGGNRLGVAQGELAATNQLNQAQTISGLYSQGYGQALSAAQQDQSRQMQASGQYANLGQLNQSLGLQGANALYGAGASQQSLAQRQYDTKTSNAKDQNMWDYQNLQYASNIAGGLGPLMGGTTTGHSSTEQQQNMGWGNYAMGIGSVLANGGRVGFADGGGVSPGDYNPDPFAQYGLGPLRTSQNVVPQLLQGQTPPPPKDYSKEMSQLGSKARKQLDKMMDSQGGGSGERASFDDGGRASFDDVGPSSIRSSEDPDSPFYSGSFEKQHPWASAVGEVAKGIYQGLGEMGGAQPMEYYSGLNEKDRQEAPRPAPQPTVQRELPATEGQPWAAKVEQTPEGVGGTGGLAVLSQTIHPSEEAPKEKVPVEVKPTPNLTTKMGLESGTADRVASLSNYSPDTKNSRSFGAYGLNNLPGNSAWQFRDEFGKKLGITADPSTPEFKKQWDAAARKDPQALIAAEDAWHNKHVTEPTTKGLETSGVPSGMAQNPAVQAFFADRSVQYGPGLAFGETHRARIKTALDESNGDIGAFLSRMAYLDKQGIPRDFRTYLSQHPDHVQGLINRVNKRTSGAMIYGSEGPAEAAPVPQGGGLAGGQAPRPLEGNAGTGLAPLVHKGGLLKRLFGIDFNPLKLSDNERSGLLQAAFASAGGNPRGIAQPMEYYSGLNEKDRQANFEGQRMAMEAQKMGQAKKQFTTIGHDDLGMPIYGFVDSSTGEISPASGGAKTMATGSGGVGQLGDKSLKGQEYLDTIPEESLRERAASILRGDSAMPKASKSDPTVNAVRQVVLHADPTFSEDRASYKKAWDDPNRGVGMQSAAFNTGIRHLKTLSELADQMPDMPVRGLNAAKNWWKYQTNDPLINEWNATAELLAGEVAKVASGKAPTQHEIESIKQEMNPNQGRESLNRVMEKYTELMAGKSKSLENDFVKKVGPWAKKPEVMDQENMQILADLKAKHGAEKATEGPGGKPLQVGEIRQGYRYKGGNPADKSSWEKSK